MTSSCGTTAAPCTPPPRSTRASAGSCTAPASWARSGRSRRERCRVTAGPARPRSIHYKRGIVHVGDHRRSGLQAPVPNPAWLDLITEAIIDPALPIIDPHHHLWERDGQPYFLDELLADTGTGHNIVATVYL